MGSAIPPTLKPECDTFFALHSHEYDMAHKDECGRYMQALIPYLQNKGFVDVGFLRKNPSQTQYQGHAIDALAYDLGGNLTHAIDVIGNAEQPHPWNSEGGHNRPDPVASFNEDTATAYPTNRDWLSEPDVEPNPTNMVPWVPYDENSFQELKRTLAYDYARRPQGADFDVSVWAARTFHNAYMGPEKTPLGMTAGVSRARNEWCSALGVPVIPVPPEWNIGDPV
jgi:hypothetical protein